MAVSLTAPTKSVLVWRGALRPCLGYLVGLA